MAEDASRKIEPARPRQDGQDMIRPGQDFVRPGQDMIRPGQVAKPGAALSAAAGPKSAIPHPASPVPHPGAARPEARLESRPETRPAVRPDADEHGKVVSIVQRLQQEAARHRVVRRKPWLLISVLAAVALPTLVAAIYFVAVAADRYVSEARFAVRSNDAQMADTLGMLIGAPASTTGSDSYIVADYIRSREMVAALEARLPLRQIYSNPDADWFTRLDPTVSLEDLVDYWNRRVDVYYDSTKSTISVEVQAFTPGDAERLATAVVDITRGLVNDLSAGARRDAVRFAAQELARAELRVRGARADILAFRTEHNDLDPTQSASAKLGIVAELEGQRSKLNSQLASLKGYLSDTAPQVQMMHAQMKALEGEIAAIQNQVSQKPTPDAGAALRPTAPARPGDAADPAPSAFVAGASATSGEGGMADVVGRYGELLVSQEFAEKAYVAAQGSLERAQTEADRTQSYLAVYITPHSAQTALYPARALDILITAILASIIWAIAALAALIIKDHMP